MKKPCFPSALRKTVIMVSSVTVSIWNLKFFKSSFQIGAGGRKIPSGQF
jgi:hypothetical protein